MNKIILTLLAIGFMATACCANEDNVINNNRNKRQFERGSINCFNNSIPMCTRDMKPDHNHPIPAPRKTPAWTPSK